MGELKEPFRLETERLILRDWSPDDIDRFVEGTNTPAVMRWLGGVLDTAKIDMLESRLMAFQLEYGHTFWVVERKQDGEILGFCGLKRADAPNSTITGEFEIGWRLREDAWGQGYAKEAATASLQTGFERFGARTIYAITVIGNAASWGLMKRLGMVRREDLDYPDSRFEPPLRDTIIYSIDRDIWLSRCSADRA